MPAETIGKFDTGLVEDFVRAFAQSADLTIHVHLRSGRSPHHVCEATFKGMAKALGDAVQPHRTRRRPPDHERNPVTTIAVLDYGSGNLHSVSRALRASAATPLITGDPAAWCAPTRW